MSSVARWLSVIEAGLKRAEICVQRTLGERGFGIGKFDGLDGSEDRDVLFDEPNRGPIELACFFGVEEESEPSDGSAESEPSKHLV